MEGSSKKGKGKQKREMKKIENEKELYTTFSKRKDGVFKKATELKALVNADATILMYSPSGNPYCYGNPSIESMMRPPSAMMMQDGNGYIYNQIWDECKKVEFQSLCEKHDALLDEAYLEKGKRKQIEKKALEKKIGTTASWWEDSEDLAKTKEFEASLVEMQKMMKNKLSLLDEANVGVGPYPASYGSGENGASLYDASNYNENKAAAGGSGSGSGSNANYNPTGAENNGGYTFPPFNGYGHGGYY